DTWRRLRALFGSLSTKPFPFTRPIRSPHRDRARLEVDVSPPERQQLALGHAGRDGRDVERLERIPGDSGDEVARLLLGEHVHFFAWHSWRVDRIARVARDGVPAHCCLQRMVQETVDMMHGPWRELPVQLARVKVLDMLGRPQAPSEPRPASVTPKRS